MKSSGNFFRNKDGVIPIEFAACFLCFSAIVFIFYDVYSCIMLQNRLERANYAVASIFRERSSLYPIIDGSNVQNISPLCRDPNSCFRSYELFNDTQVDELSQLASSLLGGRDVAVKVDGLFIFQNVDNPASLKDAELVTLSAKSCSSGGCSGGIGEYFSSLPNMNDRTEGSLTNYSKLAPYVPRIGELSNKLEGRWIPLYRVSMCIVNEESLYLKLVNSSRAASGFLPNLCSNFVVLSRCNDILNPTSTACPIYHR